MSGDRQKADEREQHFPCKQQDQAPFSAQPAKPQILG
jgi:hypothetical protein